MLGEIPFNATTTTTTTTTTNNNNKEEEAQEADTPAETSAEESTAETSAEVSSPHANKNDPVHENEKNGTESELSPKEGDKEKLEVVGEQKMDKK